MISFLEIPFYRSIESDSNLPFAERVEKHIQTVHSIYNVKPTSPLHEHNHFNVNGNVNRVNRNFSSNNGTNSNSNSRTQTPRDGYSLLMAKQRGLSGSGAVQIDVQL